MAIIPKAYDTVLDKYVMPDEIRNIYQKGQKRYQCPICFDWLSFANTEKRRYFKHWRTSDGHDNCNLYYSKYYNNNSVESEISKKLRKSKGIDYALYLEKRNCEWHLSLSLPAFSENDIVQYERDSSYIKIMALDFGTDIMLNISRENFVADERRNVELSDISDDYEITIGANGKEATQNLNGAKLDGVIFQLIGSDTIENNDQVLTKKLRSGSKIYLKRHYILLTKVLPKAEYLYGLSMIEIARISIKVGGLDKTRKIYDFVVVEDTWNSDKFCKQYGMVISDNKTATQIMWPPSYFQRDDYVVTHGKDIIIYSDAMIETNGIQKNIGLNLYKISALKNKVRIAASDELYKISFPEEKTSSLKKIECLHQQVEENTEWILSKNLIFYNNVLFHRQKENVKMSKKISLLQYKSNYLVSEITVPDKEKEIDITEDLLNAIKYCKVMITTPYWIRTISLMRYDKEVVEYINESIVRKSICREVARVLLINY